MALRRVNSSMLGLDASRVLNSQSWTSTAGQSVFTLSNGKYTPGKKQLEVFIQGVKQISGENFLETNETTITIQDTLPAGIKVEALWVEGIVPSTQGHNGTHKVGGQDELDIRDLAGYKTVVSKKESYFVSILDYSQLVDNMTNSWSNAIDQAIQDTKITGQTIWFPPGTYLINRTIVTDINTKIVGSGCGEDFTKIKLIDYSNCDMIQISKNHAAVSIKNIILCGDYAFSASTDRTLKSSVGNGISLSPDEVNGSSILNQIDISHCIIECFPEYGLKVRNKTWVCNITDLDLRRNYLGGLYDSGSDNHFNALNIYENDIVGAYLWHSSGNHYSNIKVYLNGRYAQYNPDAATGLILDQCNRSVFSNIELQQNMHNSFVSLASKNIELVNFTFDLGGYVQIKYPAKVPGNFKPIDLLLIDSYNIRGSHMVFSARTSCNLENAVSVKGGSYDVDLLYDTYSDGTAKYNVEKLLDGGAYINVRSYRDNFFRVIDQGNYKVANKNPDFFFSKNGWSKTAGSIVSTSNNVLTHTASNQNNNVYFTANTIAGHVYAIYAEVNAPVGYSTRFLVYPQSGAYTELIKQDFVGTGNFVKCAAVGKATTSESYYFQLLRDIKTSGWQAVSMKNVVIIDLTESFPDINFNGNAVESDLVLSLVNRYGAAEWISTAKTAGSVVEKVSSLPVANAGQRGRVIRIEGTNFIPPAFTMTVTNGCTVSGNVNISLEGVSTAVAVTTSDNTPTLVANKIRNTNFSGWIASGSGTTVNFVSTSVKELISGVSVTYGTTGVNSTVVVNNSGTAGTPDAAYVCMKLADDTYDWIQIG